MPIITLEGPPVEDLDKKRQLIKEVTQAAVKFYDMPTKDIIIFLKPLSPDRVGIGGKLIIDMEQH